MIPNLKKSGLLPVGIHYATWQQFKETFGFNEHRKRLLIGLVNALSVLYSSGCREIYVGGSFVTDEVEPDDIDVCFDNTNIDWNSFIKKHPEFKSTKYGNKQQLQKYGCEFFGVNAYEDYLIGYFQYDKNQNPKGIVKIILTKQL